MADALPIGELLDLKTEEDLKLRVVIPLLQQFGVTADELSCEQTFSIDVGKGTHKVRSGKAEGRLDILVRRRQRNLCVVELKRTDLALTLADCDQAVSYALLAKPNPAPLCVITNGRETKLLNPLTRTEFSPDETRAIVDGDLVPTLSLDLRREALRQFIGLSRENLATVSASQVAERSGRIRHRRDDDAWKQYAPELYVRPPAVDAAFREFSRSDARLFLLVGASGAGKTSALASIADELVAAREASFFFLARDVAGGIFESVAEELTWSLSGLKPSVGLAIRDMIDALGGANVFVVVDNLDELPGALPVLEQFLAHAVPRAKLIASCTHELLPKLRFSSGVATTVRDELAKHRGRWCVEMPELEPETFATMLANYETYFARSAPAIPELLAEAHRDPLLLRLAFETAAPADGAAGYDVRTFYENYFSRQLLGFDDEPKARRFLRGIARQLMAYGDEFADEDSLRSALGIPIGDELPLLLFRRRLLVRVEHTSGTRIGFAYTRMRDFVFAFWVEKWGNLSAADFAKRVEDLRANVVGQRALASYYRVAKVEHRRVLDEPFYSNALAFVREYSSLRRTHAPALRAPGDHGMGDVGFIGHLVIEAAASRVWLYGVRTLTPGENAVTLLASSQEDVDPDEAFVKGAWSLGARHDDRGLGAGFDPAKQAIGQLRRQLADAIKKGRFVEASAPVILTELVLARLAKRSRLRFPVDTRLALLELIAERLGDRLAWERASRGEVPTHRAGTIIAYTRDPGVSIAELRARAAMLTPVGEWDLPHDVLSYASSDDVALAEALKTLASVGIEQIAAPPVQVPKRGAPAADWAAAVARAFELFLASFRAFVAAAFPALIPARTYDTLQGALCFVTYDPERPDDLDVFVCKNDDATDSVKVCGRGEVVWARASRGSVRYDGKDYALRWAAPRSTPAEFLRPSSGFAPFDVATEYCVVRAMVYEELEQEMKGHLKELDAEDWP